MPTVTWIVEGSEPIVADVAKGQSLMEAAQDNDVPRISGDCGGCLSCATCHVVVDDAWVSKVGPADGVEISMLECTEAPAEPNSRLCCQIFMTDELEGLVLRVPG